MTAGELPPAPAPRRRAPWSFKHLVEDVSGRPITDFQEPPPTPPRPAPALPAAPPPPAAPSSPSAAPSAGPGRAAAPASAVEIPAAAADPLELPEGEPDPVLRIYPPLSGATARGLHGTEAEHHAATLRSVEGPSEPPAPGDRPHRPGPSRRPERIYLHYLLLHLDRLNDAGLRYLKHAVDEELAHREAPAPRDPAVAPPSALAARASPREGPLPPEPVSEPSPSP